MVIVSRFIFPTIITAAVFAAFEVGFWLGRRFARPPTDTSDLRKLFSRTFGRRRARHVSAPSANEQVASILAAVRPFVVREVADEYERLRKKDVSSVDETHSSGTSPEPTLPPAPLPAPTAPAVPAAPHVITIFKNEIAGNIGSRVPIGWWRGWWHDADFVVSSIEIDGRLTRQAVQEISARIGAGSQLQSALAPVAGIDTFDVRLRCHFGRTNLPSIVPLIPNAAELDWTPDLVPIMPSLHGNVTVTQRNNSVEVNIAAEPGEV